MRRDKTCHACMTWESDVHKLCTDASSSHMYAICGEFVAMSKNFCFKARFLWKGNVLYGV